MDEKPFLGTRVLAGVTVILGILLWVAFSWLSRGLQDATALFQLLQGVLLATMTFLWGAQAVERANQRAEQAITQKAAVTQAALNVEDDVESLQEELQKTRRILARLYQTPDTRRKVEEAVREVESEDA